MKKSLPVYINTVAELGVDRLKPVALHVQLTRNLRSLIQTGRVKPHTKLPSSRQLALELKLSRSTVVEAYAQLRSEGYLTGSSGGATRVAENIPDLITHTASQDIPACGAIFERNKAPRPFATSSYAAQFFPHRLWAKLLLRHWQNPSPALILQPTDDFGWPTLRVAIADYLYAWRGISCGFEQIIITAGGVESFHLIGRAAFMPGDKLWVEEPGYLRAHHAFEQAGLKICAVLVDGEGFNPSLALNQPGARGAFITPARHYPTAVLMPLNRRLQLLAWAEKHNSLLIEDDYDCEFRFVGQTIPALMSLDQRGHVIYTGSFSTVMFPQLRLSYCVIPNRLISTFQEAHLSLGSHASLIAQPALADFIQSGAFATHIRKMRRVYVKQHHAMLAALMPGHNKYYQLETAYAGLTILLRLPPDVDDVAITKDLARFGVVCSPLSGYYRESPHCSGLILGFSAFEPEAINNAATILLARLKSLT